MGVLAGLCKTPRGAVCRAGETGLEVGFAAHPTPSSHGTDNTHSFVRTRSERGDNEFREMVRLHPGQNAKEL